MAYTAAILGCGPRANDHARAYADLDDMELVACCDCQEGRLTEFAEQHGIPQRFTDLEAMLHEVRPDVLNLVTQPNFRIVPIDMAARAGVRLVFVEKPLVLLPSEGRKLRALAEETGIKIVCNAQRRYYETVQGLKAALDEHLGQIDFVRVIMKGNLQCVGPHAMDMLLYFLGERPPVNVWATAYGAEDFHCTHSAPAGVLGAVTFPDNVQALWESSKDSVGTRGEERFWMHLEFDFWAENGRAWWKQAQNWGYQVRGMAEPVTFPASFSEHEGPGQRAFTQAGVEWLDDASRPHLNRLELHMVAVDTIMAMMKSALERRRIDLPCEVEDDVLHALQADLESREGVHPERTLQGPAHR